MIVSLFQRTSIKTRHFAVAAAFVLMTGAVPHAYAAEPGLDELMQHFDSVVFGAEIEGVKPAEYVQKWMTPIRVSITAMQGNMINKPDGKRELKLSYAPPGKYQVDMIRKHLTTLVKLTGAQSEKSDKENGKPANFIIKFVPRLVMGQPFLASDVDPEILKRLGQPGVCYFLTRSISTGAMFRSLIVVNNELPAEQMNACLLEEITQAMGLPNDSDLVTPSIFNQKSTSETLSPSDTVLIKTLYDKRLPAGTPRRDALRIGRDIMSEHLAR
ncbi:MAG: DUF2927 domain-containing protein [Rhodospirillales bacterium]